MYTHSASQTLSVKKSETAAYAAVTAEEMHTGGWSTFLGATLAQKRGMDVVKSAIDTAKSGKRVALAEALLLLNDFAAMCLESEDHFVTLARLKDTANYAYTHPVNVCIYSMAIGAVLKYTDKQLIRLGLAGLFHDIGEARLPDRMLGKAAKYTETEFHAMKKHPELGYDLLKKEPSMPEDVLMAVLHHHERVDGSGYPSGHSGRFIHPMGKILAVAESYDAMTSERSNAESMTPTDALRTLYNDSGKLYEPVVVKALLLLLGMYPMGSLVRLSGGQLAVVLSKNKSDLTKPNVIVLTDIMGNSVDPYLINLNKDKSGRQVMYPENSARLGIDTDQFIQDMLNKSMHK